MRIMVMGDLHGAYKALEQCLERSGFDYENDVLIQLGDIADGYSDVYECVEELLKIKHLIAIKGNHDEWLREFIETDFHPYFWTYGGKGTLISYLDHAGKKDKYFATGSGYKTALEAKDIPQTHKQFFKNQKLFHIDDKNRCFVHAGFNRILAFQGQAQSMYYWDRTLWADALDYSITPERKKEFKIVTKFKEIYIGHTSTTGKPKKVFNIINLDTGAGHSGKLTIMDVDTKGFWQSDPLPELYSENYRD
ncbi:metallophosphoesterase [Pedobacter nutrimenti]|uniref:metallophosphoesterase n=1 Tax=Pedobacter nutrimenti TaxID=1241337 RepID=UPI00292CCDBB|nr:metallophosphoesterase [Pedobacter nutrimenti]